MTNVLARYANFFGLFRDFRGYAEFFLLADLVTQDYGAVGFFLPCEDFCRSPLPQSVEEYRTYRELAMEFLAARNRRISESCRV